METSAILQSLLQGPTKSPLNLGNAHVLGEAGVLGT